MSELTPPSRLTMSLLDAKHLGRALIPHTNDDYAASVLAGVWIDPPEESGGQYAYASDRYTAAQFDLTHQVIDSEGDGIWIPRDALGAVMVLGAKTLLYGGDMRQYRVVFTTKQEEDRRRLTLVEVVWVGRDANKHEVHWLRMFPADGSGENRPPVGRLIKRFRKGADSRTHLGPEQIAKVTGYARWAGRNAPVRITLSDPEPAGIGKGAVVLMEVGDRFKAVMQSMLILPNSPFSFGKDIAIENATEYAEAQAKLAATKTTDSE